MSTAPTPDDDSAIEIDPQILQDDGSSFADLPEDLASFTTSCTPSITRYPFENGRRYHAFKPGTYPLPNDEAELERQVVVHHMVKKTLEEKLFLAPLGEIHRVLDIGTGTGTWCIDMGDQFPSAEILGNDLSPVQPSWVPPNVKFEVDDIESSWAYSRPFDFIFCRTLSCAVGDWPRLMRQAYQHVKPGGWVEFQDFNIMLHSEDGSYKPESDTAKYTVLLTDAAKQAGKEASPGPKLEQWVRDAGFQNVVHHKFKIPVGPWAKDKQQKEIGMFNLVQSLDGLEAFAMRLFTSVLGWSPEEVYFMCAKVRKELKNKSNHRITDFHVVYGQRPES